MGPESRHPGSSPGVSHHAIGLSFPGERDRCLSQGLTAATPTSRLLLRGFQAHGSAEMSLRQ